MAAVQNLYIDQGADFSADIGIYDDFNSPWDLNGYTGESKIKNHIIVLPQLHLL